MEGPPSGFPTVRDDDGDGAVDEAGERLGLSTRTPRLPNGGFGFPIIDPVPRQRRTTTGYGGAVGTDSTRRPRVRQRLHSTSTARSGLTPLRIFPGDPVSRFVLERREQATARGTLNSHRPAAGHPRQRALSGSSRIAPSRFSVGVLFAQGTDRFDSARPLRGQARGVHAAQASGAFEPVRVGAAPQPVPLAA